MGDEAEILTFACMASDCFKIDKKISKCYRHHRVSPERYEVKSHQTARKLHITYFNIHSCYLEPATISRRKPRIRNC